LIEPAIATGQHRNAVGLPFGHFRLDVVDDEADMVDHGALRAAIACRVTERQVDPHAGEQHGRGRAFEQLAAHADEDFLVGFRIFRREVPMTHGHARLVEWGQLCVGGPGRERRREHQSCEYR